MRKTTSLCSTSLNTKQNMKYTGLWFVVCFIIAKNKLNKNFFIFQANASKTVSLPQSQQQNQNQVLKKSTTGNQMKTIMKSTSAAANAVMNRALKSNLKQNYNLVKTNNQQLANSSIPPKYIY